MFLPLGRQMAETRQVTQQVIRHVISTGAHVTLVEKKHLLINISYKQCIHCECMLCTTPNMEVKETLISLRQKSR